MQSLIEEHAKSVEDLAAFVRDTLQLEMSQERLSLLAHRLHFYVTQSLPMDVKSECVVWQANLICFVKAIKVSSSLAILLRVQNYNGASLLVMGSKDFGSVAQQFGIVKGPSSSFVRNIQKQITEQETLDGSVSKVCPLMFGLTLDAKKVGNLTKKGDAKFMASEICNQRIGNAGRAQGESAEQRRGLCVAAQ